MRLKKAGNVKKTMAWATEVPAKGNTHAITSYPFELLDGDEDAKTLY